MPSSTLSTATKHFIRHYVEMVVAMFLGMAILALPARGVLGAAGTSWSELGTEAMFLGMAVEMTLPMVAWMRYRGHAWRPCLEMSAAMFVPTFAAIGLFAAGVAGEGVLMGAEHVAMLLAMLAAMLLRPAEYTHGPQTHGEAVAA
jgi:hypothetical protein